MLTETDTLNILSAAGLSGCMDDGEPLTVPPNQQVVAALDTIVAGVHYPPQASARHIAQRLFYTNMSDLAAMAAKPQWCLLSLALTKPTQGWMNEFAATCCELQRVFRCRVVGGDVTAAATDCVSLTALGLVEKGRALLRSTAQVGDTLWVTNRLGAASYAVRHALWQQDAHHPHLADYYTPRLPLAFAQHARPLMSAAIDVSDGLLKDAERLCQASRVGITLQAALVPQAEGLTEQDRTHTLNGGDDYQLCFTAPPWHTQALQQQARRHDTLITAIGRVVASPDCQVRVTDRPHLQPTGFTHWQHATEGK